ncbi:ATP-binding cassette domain-containing protein [Granulicella aggregans]|uniref:ATP-binding cassette domain-containing protein n=1 Tax=Granulicella aggregans TaxID=474949 RepID=UPI00161F39D3
MKFTSGRLPGRLRTPPIHQLSSYECGAACLTMVLQHHGHAANLSEIRDECGVGRDGVSALTLVKVASARGFTARAFGYTLKELGECRVPVILHWRFQHFVVFEGYLDGFASIVDPARGRLTVTLQELSDCYTGISLLVYGLNVPKAIIRPRIPGTDDLRTLLSFCLRSDFQPSVVTSVIISSITAQLAAVALPLIARFAINKATDLGSSASIAKEALPCILLALGCLGLSTLLRNAVLVKFRSQINLFLSSRFFLRTVQLPVAFLLNRDTGDLLLRLESNGRMRDALANLLVSGIVDLTFMLSYCCALLIVAPTLFLLAVPLAALHMALFSYLSSIQRPMRVTEMAERGRENGLAIEIIQNIVTVKALGAGDQLLERWVTRLTSALQAESARAYVAGCQDVLQTIFRQGVPWILVLVGCSYVSRGQMSVGSLFAASALALQAIGPYTSLLATSHQLSLLRLDLDRITDITSAATEQSQAGQKRVTLRGNLEVVGVSFRYSKEGPYVLRGVSFSVKPGGTIGIVGRSGSGKSTLLQLLLGFYAPTEGTISYDGHPINTYAPDHLRSQLGVVLQDSHIFSSTIKGNVELRTGPVSRDRLMQALSRAHLDEFVESLPMREHTFMAYSSALSGGERQRLAIARALVNNPQIVLFDEATSHLDSQTEQLIMQSLRELEVTQILIAHRLSTLSHCDSILVLEHGVVVEHGSHAELLGKRGAFWSMLNVQRGNLNEVESGIAQMAV